MGKAIFAIILMVAANAAFADTRSSIALSDRSLWPEKINNANNFNRASLAEILVFTNAFNEKEKMSLPEYREWLNLKSVNMDSTRIWRKKTESVLLLNYQLAAKLSSKEDFLCSKSVRTFKDLSDMAHGLALKTPYSHKLWLDNSMLFHEIYLHEQSRLAAISPEVTSEIAKLDNEEIDGFEMRDKQFLLTFDDGPSEPDGTTDKLIKMLKRENKTGVFFMVGKNLGQRLKIQTRAELVSIYSNMCVASHGMEHKSHAKWSEWQNSMDNTAILLQNTLGKCYWPLFRPPYGQRSQELLAYAQSKGIRTVLWNIDSQDWNSEITASQASDRVLTLMLLWRRGIILFHDIQDKAANSLPELFSKTQGSGIMWIDYKTSREP